MRQSAAVARAPGYLSASASRSVRLRGAAREALWGTGWLHVAEAAAADCEGTAGSEANNERCAALLAWFEGGGIAGAAAVTQKGLFPYHTQETVNVYLLFPARNTWETPRELDSAVKKRIWEFEATSQFHIDFVNILHFCIFHYNSHVWSNFAISHHFSKYTSCLQ